MKRPLVLGLLSLLLAIFWPRATRADGEFAAGATFTQITSGDIVNVPAYYWGGCWGDYDDDGWLDLFVGSSYESATNFLYRNERDGSFTLVDAAQMPKSPSHQHGSAWADYDNDSDLDLIVTARDRAEHALPQRRRRDFLMDHRQLHLL